MNPHSTVHCSFTIERHFDASPAQVFNAWSNPDIKGRWFNLPEIEGRGGYKLDFRIGGHEHVIGGTMGGPRHIYDARIEDIVPGERIVYSYDMCLEDKLVSVSLATVELQPEGGGTHLVFTEQDVFLDDAFSDMSREEETRILLDNLEDELRRERPLA